MRIAAASGAGRGCGTRLGLRSRAVTALRGHPGAATARVLGRRRADAVRFRATESPGGGRHARWVLSDDYPAPQTGPAGLKRRQRPVSPKSHFGTCLVSLAHLAP